MAAAVRTPRPVLSLAAARDQANEEFKAAAEQAVSVRQQAAVRAGFSACPLGKRDGLGIVRMFLEYQEGLPCGSD